MVVPYRHDGVAAEHAHAADRCAPRSSVFWRAARRALAAADAQGVGRAHQCPLVFLRRDSAFVKVVAEHNTRAI